MAQDRDPTGGPEPRGRHLLRSIFAGPRGLRAGWSLLLFAGLFAAPAFGLSWLYLELFPPPPASGWTPGSLIAAEAISFAAAVFAVAVMAGIEKRSFALYGFPWRRAFGRRFWEGSGWGILSISSVILLIATAGGYRVAGLAVSGATALRYALLWGLALLLVGLYEELFFRAFPLFTLSRGIGFWPAALLLSAIFGALHYFLKPMETWIDGVSTGLLGLLLCLSVRRTGDVWFAVGWHFTYNWGSLFVFGGPNTGNQGRPVEGHLLDSSFHGPDWLTGGPMGPEASVFIFAVAAVLFVALHRRFPKVAYPPGEGGETPGPPAAG